LLIFFIVYKVKPIKVFFKGSNSKFTISSSHFSSLAALSLNAKIKDLLLLSDKKKIIRGDSNRIIAMILKMLCKEIGSWNYYFIVTHQFTLFIPPKANTHKSIFVIFCSFRVINFLFILCLIPFSLAKKSLIILLIVCCLNTFCHKVMVIGCFSIKFPTNDVVTVTYRTNPLFIPTGFVCTAPTFHINSILFASREMCTLIGLSILA
jgi:hypothetical protein